MIRRTPHSVRIGRPQIVVLCLLLLGLGLRLYGVTSPYLDHHSWRQTDTAAIARNFYRHGFNILKPEVDWGGAGSSVAELEFQVTPLLTAALYAVWGIRDWVGRVVPILFSLVSLGYYHKLVRLYSDEGTAGFATFALAILPLGVFFTRVPMPESGAMFFSIAAMYHLSRYRSGGQTAQFWLAAAFSALAFLSKLTVLYLLAPLLFILVRRDPTGNRPAFWMIALFVLVPLAATASYYGYMHTTADIKLIPYALGTDKWGSLGIWSEPAFYSVMLTRLRTVVFTWLGLALLLIGLFLPGRTRVFHLWLLAATGYVMLVATGNLVHSYYQMPLIPAGAYFIGLVLQRLYASRLRPLAVVAAVVLTYLSVINLLPMYGPYAYPAYEAAAKLRAVDGSRSLVLYVPHRPDMNPEFLYYADRRGWIISPRDVSVSSIEAFRQRGARYLVLPTPRSLSGDLRRYLSGKSAWIAGRYLIIQL